MWFRSVSDTVAAILCIAVLATACGGAAPPPKTPTVTDGASRETVTPDAHLVLFMMATCPHCARALQSLLPVVKELGPSVAFQVAYIGATFPDGNPVMDESDPETQAAVVEMCAGMNAPTQQWLSFMSCIYRDDQWKKRLGDWRGCSKSAHIDPALITACQQDGSGRAQLSASILASVDEGIEGAPTLFIDGQRYLGSLTRNDLLVRLCHGGESDLSSRPYCKGIAKPTPFEGILLEDQRCAQMEACDVSREVAFLKTLMPAMTLRHVDYQSAEGLDLYQQIVEANGPKTIPTLVLGTMPKEDSAGYEVLGQYLLPFGDGAILPLGQGFDPRKEICDNGTDDNGDKAVDCADQECARTLGCRKEITNRVDLFIMSQCPYAAMMVPTVDAFLKHIAHNGDPITFKFQFIGTVTEDGFDSMHGPAEVAEDLRMICLQELSPQEQFLSYMMCRARDYRSDRWEDCLPKGVTKKAVETCAQGEKGAALLSNSFALAEQTGMLGSPMMMLNNRYPMEGRTPKAMLEAFCARNKNHGGCKMPMVPSILDRSINNDQPPTHCQ